MKTVTLKNGDILPALGMGTWFIGDDIHKRKEEIGSLRYGIEHGINLIDTAEMYGDGRSENLVGEAISPYSRESIYLISKVLPSHANNQHLEKACDRSLKRLNTDYLDMYLYHWRGITPLKETVYGLERLREKGKIKSWGVSNFDLEDMQELLGLPGGNHCQTNEVLFHLGSRGIEYVLKPYQDNYHIPTIAYCPLAQAGSLKQELLKNKAVQTISNELNCSPYQVLLLFVLSQPNIIAIPKASNIQHIKENIACLDIELSSEQLILLNEVFPTPKKRESLDVV